ncbi:xanthine dehydrogenase family protein molybdopterin-binding subunit [Nocardioides sp. SYSU DS0663]|uniref:xanthine dehydrogenase family protein molybdopterin-binding subunit n=1 Tax=Nocardioides sp. SYSU DS0663 TaxID=3416445 RepID=UPI003F4B3A45
MSRPPAPAAPAAVPPAIGSVAVRADVLDKLLGDHRFATQEHAEGELHLSTVRSPCASARIDALHLEEARAVPGAVTVLTGRDVPGRRLGSKVQDQPVLADQVVRHHGEAMALVVAETPAAARRMAARVRAELSPLPVLLDPARALDPGAPVVGPEGNLVARHRTARGSAVRRPDDVVVRCHWRTGRQDAAFLAPEAGVAVPRADGSVLLTLATQDLHADHAQVVRALGLAPHELELAHSGIGGAFGGREDISLQAHLVLAARTTGRPVRAAYSRAESLLAHPSRHPVTSDVELVARPDGRFVSLRVRTLVDGGAYALTSTPVSAIVHDFSAGLYVFEEVDVETTAVHTHHPPAGAMRGFGATQACFLIESTVDAMARRLGRDPVALRRQNLLRPGEPLALTGQPYVGSADPRDVLDALEAVPRTARPVPASHRRGAGVALGIKSAGLGHGRPDPATVAVTLTADEVVVESAAADVGQGVTEVLRRVVGECLPGRPVRVVATTTAGPTAGGSKASRQTMASGGAAYLAAQEVRRLLDRRSTPLGEETIRHVVTHDGPDTGPDRPHKAFQVVAHRAEVDVDEVTGRVRVARVVAVQDCGRAIDPVAVEGQLVGGTVQGVGFALHEERRLDADGRQLTTGYGDYLLPLAHDVPEVLAVALEHPHPDLVLGAKGIGEGPLVSSPAAVAAAVRDATGAAVEAIPVTPPGRAAALAGGGR